MIVRARLKYYSPRSVYSDKMYPCTLTPFSQWNGAWMPSEDYIPLRAADQDVRGFTMEFLDETDEVVESDHFDSFLMARGVLTGLAIAYHSATADIRA